MTDLEIDRALALAIGYRPEDVRVDGTICRVRRHYRKGSEWHIFFHHDPTIVWPIAAKYNCFPGCFDGKWYANGHKANTPEQVVALAVIRSLK